MTTEEQIRADEEQKIYDAYSLLMLKDTEYDNGNMADKLAKYEDFYKQMAVMRGIIINKPVMYFRREKEAFSRIKKTYKEQLDKRVKEILDKSIQ